jgi:hypothetical protein
MGRPPRPPTRAHPDDAYGVGLPVHPKNAIRPGEGLIMAPVDGQDEALVSP